MQTYHPTPKDRLYATLEATFSEIQRKSVLGQQIEQRALKALIACHGSPAPEIPPELLGRCQVCGQPVGHKSSYCQTHCRERVLARAQRLD